ncbi:hypothetical protein KsCSTR_15380 [Candidatus Kuenenia stuttgartiensis]|nr:hypothetical protein KsCSTR_15380 [Candidatus Kuenenia stuttgartiensis]SOH03492.1 hypothetical protein KSMBR1_0981 [Candidatus Kuenenia stuttgartiensis]
MVKYEIRNAKYETNSNDKMIVTIQRNLLNYRRSERNCVPKQILHYVQYKVWERAMYRLPSIVTDNLKF